MWILFEALIPDQTLPFVVSEAGSWNYFATGYR